MTPSLFAYWLSDILPKIIVIDGLLFLDRLDRGESGIREEIAKHESAQDAQRWINIVPWDDALNDIVGEEWSVDDNDIGVVMGILRRCMEMHVASALGAVPHSVEIWRDSDLDEIGLIVSAI